MKSKFFKGYTAMRQPSPYRMA